MTSKVEELRAKLIDGRGMLVGRVRDLDDLLVAQVADVFPKAKAEGVAEGAEQAKTDLETWLLKEGNVYVENTMLSTTHYMKHINVQDVVDFLHDRLFVLAPTKESEK